MSKRKKSKKKVLEGLQELFEVGDVLTVKAVNGEGEEREVSRTPVRVTRVGRSCLGVRIVGKSTGRRFIAGFVFEIENVEYKVLRETKRDAVIECLDEGMYT